MHAQTIAASASSDLRTRIFVILDCSPCTLHGSWRILKSCAVAHADDGADVHIPGKAACNLELAQNEDGS